MSPTSREKAHPVARFAHDVRRDREFVRRQDDGVEPRAKQVHGHRRDFRDAPAGDPHVERVRLESRAVAGRARLRRLVLPEEDADVLLVFLGLERFEVLHDSEETLAPCRAAASRAARARVRTMAGPSGSPRAWRTRRGRGACCRSAASSTDGWCLLIEFVQGKGQSMRDRTRAWRRIRCRWGRRPSGC